LFEANPSAVLTGDNAGLLPLHVAAFRSCASEAEAESETDASDHDVPDTASDVEQPAKLDVLYNLLRAEPSVLRVSTSFL
jgi:hypothetical protein